MIKSINTSEVDFLNHASPQERKEWNATKKTRELENSIHSSQTECSKIMKPGDICYGCECFPGNDYIMCRFCFEFNLIKHANHKYKKVFLEDGGTCDCPEISGSDCKTCFKILPYKLKKSDIEYFKDVIKRFVEHQVMVLSGAHMLIPRNDTYSIIILNNHCELVVNMEIILKKTNLKHTYQDVYNIIDKCVLTGQMIMNKDSIDKDFTMDKTARLFLKYQFYSLTNDQLMEGEICRKRLKEILPLLKYKEIRDCVSRILKTYHVTPLYSYCKNLSTENDDRGFLKYVGNNYKKSNHLEYLLFNILRVLPQDSEILFDLFIILLEDEENKIIIGNNVIENYMNNVDYYLSGYTDIRQLNRITTLIFSDNNIIKKLDHPFKRLFELVIEFQRRYDTVEPGEVNYTPTRRDAYRLVVELYFININLVIDLPNILSECNYDELLNNILNTMELLMHDKIVGDNHLRTKRELLDHIANDIVNLAQGPLFRFYLYKIISNLYKVFRPNGTNNYYNLKLIIDRIIMGNTKLMIECYNNQDIHGENGYLMFLHEHLFSSILYTMNSNELNKLHSDLYRDLNNILVYNEEEKISSSNTSNTTNTSISNVMGLDNDPDNFISGIINEKLEIDDSEEYFKEFNVPMDENERHRIMPIKTIPLTLFGCLRYFLTVIQHKSNMWVKNGLMFTAKVKSCCSPFNYELMCHFLQFMISFTNSEKILKLLEEVFNIYTAEHNYLNQSDVNLNYYNEFLTFVLTLLTNPIPSFNKINKNNNIEEDNSDDDDDEFGNEERERDNIIFNEYIKVDIVHLLLVKKYCFNDITGILNEKYFYIKVDDIKERVIQQLDIISDYNHIDGLYSLKKQFNYYYNPFYLNFIPNQSLFDNSNSIFSDHSEFKPFPLLYNSNNRCLMNLYNSIYSIEYNELIKTNLEYFQNNINNQSNSKVFTIFQPTLWMIIIEIEEKRGCIVDVTNLKTVNENNNNKTFTILLKYRNDTVFGKQIQYILRRFDELGIIISEDSNAMNNNNNNSNDNSDVNKAENRSKRKLESIRNRMKSKQQKVIETLKIDMEEEEKEDNHNSNSGDNNNNRSISNDSFPECVICKSNTNNDINIGPLIMPVTIIPIISYNPQTINVNWAIPVENNNKNNNNNNHRNDNDGLGETDNNINNNNNRRNNVIDPICQRRKIISCNHIMHLKCLNESAERSFFQKVLQQMVSPVDVKRREYTCPICRGVYNLCLLIPNHCDEYFLPRLIEKGEVSEYIYWLASILRNQNKSVIKPYIDREMRYYLELYHPVAQPPPPPPQPQPQPPASSEDPSQQQQQQNANDNNIITITTTSLGAVPLPYDNEIIHNYVELYSILSTTIIDSANSLNVYPVKRIDYFMIKCLLFNAQYFLSTQFQHIYDEKKFSIEANPDSYLEMLLYQIFSCDDSMSVFCVFVRFLYKCLCCYYDTVYIEKIENSSRTSKSKKNKNNKNSIKEEAMKKHRNQFLKEMSDKLIEYNNLDEFYRNSGENSDIYHKILDPIDYEMKIVFIIYHSFNSNSKSNEIEMPEYDFISCFINFDLPKIINDYRTPSDFSKLKLYPSLHHPEKFHLIDLPMNNNVEELMTRYLTVCKCCKTVPQNPGLCLICGEILCPNCVCCEYDKTGEVTMHCIKYHGGIGITLSLSNYKIYLTRFQYTLEYMQLYIKDDPKQGEKEIKSRYDILEDMFENDKIFETVFQKIDLTPFYIIHNAF